MNCCMRVPLRNCISFVIDKHNIHFVSYYCKYDVIGDPKEVNFSRGAHSTNPCGTSIVDECLGGKVSYYV